MHLFAVVLVSELPFVSSSLKLVLPVLFPCLLCVFFCDVFRILKVFLLHICSLFVVIVIQRTCIQVPPLTEGLRLRNSTVFKVTAEMRSLVFFVALLKRSLVKLFAADHSCEGHKPESVKVLQLERKQ